MSEHDGTIDVPDWQVNREMPSDTADTTPTANQTDEGEDMNENNDPREAAADPPSDHETPGGQPGDHEAPESTDTETQVETPGGTTVTEKPADSE